MREHFAQQGMIESVPRLVGMQVPEDRSPGQRQVTTAVENLVARKFVGEAQALGIHHAIFVYQHCVAHRTTQCQSLGAQLFEFIGETESACGCDFGFKHAVNQVDRNTLLSDRGTFKIDLHGNAWSCTWLHDGEALALTNLNRAFYPDAVARYSLADNARLLDDFDDGRTTAIEYRYFLGADFNHHIVDAAATYRRQQVLDGADSDTMLVA